MGISLQLTSGKPKEPKEIRAWASHLKFQMASNEGGRKEKGEERGRRKVVCRK